MKKHFVEFLSPGTFVSEMTTKEIDSWDVKKAQKMANEITERYNSKPYGFRFTTRERGEKDLDSKETKTSGIYYLNAIVETLAQVKKRNDPKESILRSNMEINGYKMIVTNGPDSKTWKFTFPFDDGKDVIL